jgi:hypothetical protein
VRIGLSRLAGGVLIPGRRTVTATLRIVKRDPHFCTFCRLLYCAASTSHAIAGRRLIRLIKAFVPSGAAGIGIDAIVLRRMAPLESQFQGGTDGDSWGLSRIFVFFNG